MNIYKKIVFGSVVVLSSCVANADTMRDVVMRTVQVNPDLLSKVKEFLGSEQAIKRAQGGYFPSIDLNADFGSEKTKIAPSSDYVSLTKSSIGISLRQLIFDGFATSSEVSRTKHHATAQKYQVEGAANDTALITARAYLDVLTAQQIVKFAQNNYDSHQRIYNMIRHRAESGVGREADVSQASGRLALARTNLLAAQNNYMDARATYYKIVGTQPQNLVFSADPSDVDLPNSEVVAIKNSIDNHPLLKMAQADTDEAKAQHSAAKSPYFPRLDGVLSASLGKNVDGNEGDYGKQSAMLELSYNLFRGGSDVARDKETAYYVEQAEQIRNRTYDQVVENTKLSWDALVTAKNQLTYFKQHRDSSAITVDAYYRQFQLNKRTLLDLLNASDELFNAKVDYIKGSSNLTFSKFRVLNAEGQLLSYLGIPVNYSGDQTYNGPSKAAQKPKPVLSPQVTKTVPARYTVSDKQIAAQSVNNYTIQLYSSYGKKDAVDFILRNNLQNQGAFYQTKYLGQTKYVVVYGSYSSPQAALSAMQALPRDLQNWNPVIKPLNIVRSEIAG